MAITLTKGSEEQRRQRRGSRHATKLIDQDLDFDFRLFGWVEFVKTTASRPARGRWAAGRDAQWTSFNNVH